MAAFAKPLLCAGRFISTKFNLKTMKKGMIFDLYQDGQPTKRVMAINEKDVMDLQDGTLIFDIDFENEVGEILIDNVFEYGM
jgi:hypothetical protein